MMTFRLLWLAPVFLPGVLKLSEACLTTVHWLLAKDNWEMDRHDEQEFSYSFSIFQQLWTKALLKQNSINL